MNGLLEQVEGDWLARFEAVRNDPLVFLSCCKTIDPSDKSNPIKPFPVHLDYLKLYVRLWQKKRRLAVPKSRRMRMTWINIALFLWDAAFHKGRHFAFVSKKEEHADELIKKCKFILDNIDEEKLPRELVPKYEITFNRLKFPDIESVIMGFPSGADQLRQFTFSGIFFDEMGFLDDAEAMYSASFPTIEGVDGRFVAVSSPAPGFFKRLVLDELDGIESNLRPMKILHPMHGVEIRENPKNGFSIFQCHYSADPEKRVPGYIEAIKQSMPIRKFNQEYELIWDSYEGLPVYADWDNTVHAVNTTIEPEIGLPLLCGVDFGLTPAMLVCQLQGETLCCLKEFTAVNMGAERFFAWVIPQLRIAFPMWQALERDYLMFIDPSGQFRADSDESTCAQVISAFGFSQIIPGAIAWEERKTSVERFLTRRTKLGHCFRVSVPNCPILTRGFQGGYRYDDKVIEREPNKLRPLKDSHSHIQDALQMVCSRILTTRPSSVVDVPRLTYSLTDEQSSFSDSRLFQ